MESIKSKPKQSLLLPGIFGVSGLAIMAVALPFTMPGFRKICLPYVPATDAQVRNVLKCLNFSSERSKLVDLGSGDGRIVLAAAQKGFHSTGIELNPWLLIYSKINAHIKGLTNLAKFERKNLWRVNLSKYDNIVIFGVDEMMPLLKDKIISDLKTSENSHNVVACRFPLPDLDPQKIVGTGLNTVWVYKFSKK